MGTLSEYCFFNICMLKFILEVAIMEINKNKEISNRNTTLDLIRIFACFCVISFHFFLNNGFNYQPVIGKRMFLMVCIRSFFKVCVPLFVILSGYLEKDKILCKTYYTKLIKVIGIYILSNIAIYIYQIFYLKQDLSLKALFVETFNYFNYAWYIEMYIGLVLLIPFLNILYRSLTKKQEKQCLIFILCLITSLPGIINVYNINEASWWLHPTQSYSYQKIIPGWWLDIWPITYYFIGCYIKDYSIKIKKTLNILYIFILTLLYGTYCYWRSHEVNFIWGVWQDWGSLPNLMLAVLVFIFILNIKMDGCPRWCKLILKHCSDACLGAYLVSYIFDNMFYAKLNALITYMPQRLNYYFIMVGSVFICSMALSMVLSIVYNGLVKLVLILGKSWHLKQN